MQQLVQNVLGLTVVIKAPVTAMVTVFGTIMPVPKVRIVVYSRVDFKFPLKLFYILKNFIS